ncbi:MAG: TRAP transporter substrate-binding protein [Gammaproteobacteria bacterium]|uniref:Tripartite ATP-independent transporter solute receptor, DctP family n=1 Tax=Marinomonas polaris DSM 16579 TaxID=1122206 RepID=A0A1M5FQ50_9GAMM|nr:TRAP transporter substrate-binding protein [Marinomonas polaris]MBU1295075.1 TRAP transporter substrate-binding protein [Gammaproteobacteria bacterium]MBU1466103.1 TRAP transporter substrate-binding protein [Gammaproteobacteria bacterium]MBU2021902.1 TRAP transporter substrate-binding protein [Gammaproteobacteria bacterium]MBU2239535.1 TRAP transporter substrate-binding protein [Gammaproteobacteria bacterium]MBU2318841.1 TRAP transporter substrate-binding protein [Gammaproteobacteria bacter
MKKITISKKAFKSILAITIGTTLTIGSISASAQDVNSRIIRFGYGLNQDSKQGRAVQTFTEEVNRLSDGKFKVKSFANALLGNEIQMQNALIGGAQEMMITSTSSLIGIDKKFAIWDLPFMFKDGPEADKVLDGKFGQAMLDGLEKHGVVGLVYWENGFRDLTNSKRPIKTMDDLNSVKLRVMQNPMYLELFNQMGANAIPMAFSELFTALETGAVDGQENPYSTIQSSKFYEVQKYLSQTHHVYSPWVMLISKPFWDKLSNDEKTIIKKAAVISREAERKDSREQAEKSLAFLKTKMEVNSITPEEMDKMKASAKIVIDAQAKELGQDLLDQFFAAIKEAKSK